MKRGDNIVKVGRTCMDEKHREHDFILDFAFTFSH